MDQWAWQYMLRPHADALVWLRALRDRCRDCIDAHGRQVLETAGTWSLREQNMDHARVQAHLVATCDRILGNNIRGCDALCMLIRLEAMWMVATFMTTLADRTKTLSLERFEVMIGSAIAVACAFEGRCYMTLAPAAFGSRVTKGDVFKAAWVLPSPLAAPQRDTWKNLIAAHATASSLYGILTGDDAATAKFLAYFQLHCTQVCDALGWLEHGSHTLRWDEAGPKTREALNGVFRLAPTR